jgi:glycerol uptake facilitator-like aquaporin
LLLKRAVSEGIATALLVAIVVGSGVMGERLSGGNVAIALLANALATGAGLVALILTFGPISGAHMNPLVTVAEVALGRRPKVELVAYVAAQVLGAVLGVLAAHAMFDLPLLQISAHDRSGGSQLGSEVLATFGLLGVILVVARTRPEAAPYAVGAYITAAYWFTSSTSFANPAVTLARALTDTFSGIRPSDVPGFLVGQVIGASLAIPVFNWLHPSKEAS